MHYVRPLDWREGGGGGKRKTSYFVIKYGKGKRELTAPETRWRFPWFRRQIQIFFFSANNARSLYDVFGKARYRAKRCPRIFFCFSDLILFLLFLLLRAHGKSVFCTWKPVCNPSCKGRFSPFRAMHTYHMLHSKGKKEKKGGEIK